MSLSLSAIASLASHGISNFDPKSTAPFEAFSTVLTGWADLEQTILHPLFVDLDESRRVHIAWCDRSNHQEMAQFRRHAQLIALDTFDAQGLSSQRYTTVKEILGWWEDEDGLWLITDQHDPHAITLEQRWRDTMDAKELIRDGLLLVGPWCDLCFTLVNVVEVMSALHARQLGILVCRPSSFNISSAAHLTTLADIACLSGFVLPTNPVTQSDLFAHSPLDSSTLLDESYIRRNLHYLSPSAAGSRRQSDTADIFSFGTLLYQLLTGCWIDGRDAGVETDIDLLADTHRHLTCEILPPIEYLEREAALGAVEAKLPPRALSEIIMKCLARDVDDRYASLAALAYDLRRLGQICRAGGDLGKFVVGDADRLSRFHLPAVPVHRNEEVSVLERVWHSVDRVSNPNAPAMQFDNAAVRVINVWGLSGNGKTRLVQTWASAVEVLREGMGCLVAQCKLDEYSNRPMASFLQIFQSLLDRVLADPKEDAREWGQKIRDTLGQQFPVFHSMLPVTYRRLLLLGGKAPPLEDIDWKTYLPAFRSWSQRLLQVFANVSRPLVVIIDDLQWMKNDEVHLWRNMVDGQTPLNHIMIVTIFRTESDEHPPSSGLIGAAGESLRVPRLPEEGVQSFLRACFAATIDGEASLTSFLFAETSGSPLYLRSLLSSLVRERVIRFDFDTLQWRYDPLHLESHLSDAGIDSYLQRTIRSLPAPSRAMLQALSSLPVHGSRRGIIQDLFKTSDGEVDSMISAAKSTGFIISDKEQKIRFTHDRQRSAAYNSIPPTELARHHSRMSQFLRQREWIDEYLFEAANHAIHARDLGATESPLSVAELLVHAAERSAATASFNTAGFYLDSVDKLVGVTWMTTEPELFLRYLQIMSQVYIVLEKYDAALDKLVATIPHCSKPVEEVRLALLRVRVFIGSNRAAEGMDLLRTTFASQGFDLAEMDLSRFSFPRSVEEIESLTVPTSVDELDNVDNDVPELLMALLCYAGPAIFVSEIGIRRTAFSLGMSLAVKSKLRHHTAAYIASVFGITSTDLDMQESACRLAKRLCALRPNSWLSSSTLVVIAAQVHFWAPFSEVVKEGEVAIDLCLSLSNHELAAYVFALDLATRRFSNLRHDLNKIHGRYVALRNYVSTGIKVLVNAPLQYTMKLLETPPEPEPWNLEGQLLSRHDIDSVRNLAWHVCLCKVFSLRLAVLFDAPLAYQLQLVEDGAEVPAVASNTIFASEWSFLTGVVYIRCGVEDRRLDDTLEAVRLLARKSADFQLRQSFLVHLQSLSSLDLGCLLTVEDFINQLEDREQYALAALLSLFTADAIRRNGHRRLSQGFLRSAFCFFREAEMFAVCHILKERHPDVCPDAPSGPRHPPFIVSPPVLRRAQQSGGQETILSVATSGKDNSSSSSIDESLDTMTLMRSSLILASEQDPQVLLCSLLRILCQFARADFAAIALSEDDSSKLQLRAAGRSTRILPYNIEITDEVDHELCPSLFMMHVGRTGKLMDRPEIPSRHRVDPFYSKPPKTILCMPIFKQNSQAGVILLSSSMTSSVQLESHTAREIISTLATFATIVSSNYSFTHRLQTEVDRRTLELTNALHAKTQFLSQCSHELRSPLSAVLGLSTVLEQSAGLTEVQKEHLRTIISSGEDLLGLINNILDLSKIESHSVQLERIPFDLRDAVESSLEATAAAAQQKDLELCLVNPITEDPPNLRGDHFRVKQVLRNLLSNGIKFTSKGRVTVYWRYERFEENSIRIWLDVEDTGTGIAASNMDKLFKNFSQVDESITRSFGGSGLGLVISREMARLLGGDVTVTSELGKGSVFTFSFVAECLEEAKDIPRTPLRKSCFVLCPLGPWWDMLNLNLRALECQPVRFSEDVEKCLVSEEPHGLNSNVDFNVLFLDTNMITPKILDQMRKLQPKAKMVYLVPSMKLDAAMKTFNISRESIVARPIKFHALYEVLAADVNKQQEASRKASSSTKRKVNPELYKKYPLSILLVDDNPVNVNVGARILGLFGYTGISTAMNGKEGVEAAEAKRYDLILLDLAMPVLNGYDALQRIKDSPLAGNPCVVALTANADEATRRRCLEAGFYSHLSKPLVIPDLEKILAKAYEYVSSGKGHSQHSDGL